MAYVQLANTLSTEYILCRGLPDLILNGLKNVAITWKFLTIFNL